MAEKTYRAILGLTVLDTTGGKNEPFLCVGLNYDGLKDSHRQVIQDVLLDHDEEIVEAFSPIVEKLNGIGQVALADDEKYTAGTQAAEAVAAAAPSRKRKRKRQG